MKPSIRFINEWKFPDYPLVEPWGYFTPIQIQIGYPRRKEDLWDYLCFEVIVLGVGFNISFS